MLGHQETGAMEYSPSYTEPKLIDFFKSEMPLRKDRDMEMQTCVYRLGNQQLGTGYQGEGAWQEPAIADGALLQLEPSSRIFVDFLGGNGNPNHQLGVGAAMSRSSSAANEVQRPMALESRETTGEWSLLARPNLPNLALKLLSPSPTGTQGSGTSAPKTPTFDMELNSRRDPPCVSIPDQYEYSAEAGESELLSADSGRFGSLPDAIPRYRTTRCSRHGDRMHNEKAQFNGDESGSRVFGWSPESCTTSYGQKRLKTRASDDDGAARIDANLEPRTRDVSTQTLLSDPSQMCRKLREEIADDENQAVVQAATSLLSLSSNEDDWQPLRPPNIASSSSLAAVREGHGEGRESGRESEEVAVPASSSVGCSSVLSRPSNKRRYRLVVDLLAESSRVR